MSFLLGDFIHALYFILTETLGTNYSDSNFKDEVTKAFGS